MRKVFLAMLIISLMILAGCASNDTTLSSVSEPCSITELTIDNDEIFIKSGEKYISDKINVNYVSTDNKDYKNVVWVSSNPNVAIVETWVGLSDSFKGKISVGQEGETEIYVQTPDGNVISNKILLIYGEKQQGRCYIKSLIIDKTENIWVGSQEKETSIQLKFKSPFKDDNKYIKWVSSNPEIATVVSSDDSYYNIFKGKISFLSEGETEIYAQTIDGNIISNKIKYIFGNKYNKEEAVKNNIDEYVFKKLKYNAVSEDKAYKIRPFYIKTWYNKDAQKIVYKEYEKVSKINCDSVKISEDNLALVTGSASTFNENALEVACNFSIKLQYNADFNEYQVISEQYDMPELIRDSIE